MHGGGAPQVKKSAQERLLELFEPSIDALKRALRSGDMKAAVRAATHIVDRVVGRSPLPLEIHASTGDVPATRRVDYNLLTNDELELFVRLFKKVHGQEDRTAPRITFGPVEYPTFPDSDQRYRAQTVRLEWLNGHSVEHQKSLPEAPKVLIYEPGTPAELLDALPGIIKLPDNGRDPVERT